MRTSRGKASGLSGVDEKNRRMRNVVGPTTSSVLTICSRNPATIDATVMAMASIVAGFREQIVNTLEVVGPTTFRILRFFSSTPLNPDALPREVRIRPALAPEEAEAIARLPEIHYAAIWTQLFYRFEYAGTRTQILGVFGADDRYMEILGGGLVTGRVFTTAELRSGAPVAVIEQRTVDRLFGAHDPIGEIVRIGGRPVPGLGGGPRPPKIFSVAGAPG